MQIGRWGGGDQRTNGTFPKTFNGGHSSNPGESEIGTFKKIPLWRPNGSIKRTLNPRKEESDH